MLMAVSCLSPVSTQIFRPASDKLAIVCETPSCGKKGDAIYSPLFAAFRWEKWGREESFAGYT